MKAKKVLALVLAAIMLVCTSVAATIAYFTDSKQVVNTFTVGKIAIKLDETKVDEYGAPTQGRTETGNDYKLIPGHTYTKDPTVTLAADSESAYIRVLVTVTDLTDVKAVLGTDAATGYFLPQNFVSGWDSTIWQTTNIVKEDSDTATYEFRYYTAVNTVDAAEKELEPLFTSFTIPAAVTADNLLKLEEMEINIVAHAMQAGTFDNADEAWAQF